MLMDIYFIGSLTMSCGKITVSRGFQVGRKFQFPAEKNEANSCNHMFTLNITSTRKELSFSWSSEARFQTEAFPEEGENKQGFWAR